MNYFKKLFTRQTGDNVVVIPPLAFLKAMFNIAWSAFRNPTKVTEIDLMTGNIIEPVKSTTFTGILSGDYECFCFDVDAETFKRIMDAEPTEYNVSRFNKGTYRLYASDIIDLPEKSNVEVTISYKVLE